MRKKPRLGSSHYSRICSFRIWSKHTSKSSICSRRTRDTTTYSCRVTSRRSIIINLLSLYADNKNQKMKTNKMNNGKLNGKVALVTGGTSGIGKTTAIEFARAGAKVVVTGRREKEGAQVVDEIRKLGGDAEFVRADVAKDADVKAMVDFTVSKHGRLDIAFNNAGVEWTGPLDQATDDEYRRVFDINVWGVLNSMRHEIPLMLKTGGGAIVNNSSVAGHVGLAQVSVYIASKHAVEGMTKSIELEIGKQNIRIN